jgi:predicted DNA-binding transcriptional regulator YafY
VSLRTAPRNRLKFAQHRRLHRLQQTLEEHPTGVTLEELAQSLQVSTRSVRRYLGELELRTELDSVETAPGGPHLWRIKPRERARAVALRRTQAFGLLATRRVFDVLRGSALFDELDLALREILQIAHRPTKSASGRPDVSPDLRLEDRFLYVPATAKSYAAKSDDLDELFQSVAELRALRFLYRAPGAPKADKGRPLIVHPYALVVHDGSLHCIARNLADGLVRVFSFDRMSEIEAQQEERFVLPPDFDVAEFVQGEFGIARATRATRVVVEFDAKMAEEVRSRRVHPTQKMATSPDGRVRLSMSVADPQAVKSWVLGFGSSARVIEPEELAAEVASELRRALARYES